MTALQELRMDEQDLEAKFPGLFTPSAFQSLAEAERYSDNVAARSGLTVRTSTWTADSQVRHIEYQDPLGVFKLQVQILTEGTRSSRPFYLFRCTAERLDLHILVQSRHTVRAKPAAFQHEAASMLNRLRALQVSEEGRVTGRLKKWNVNQGRGVIELFPGATVSLFAADLPSGYKVAPNDLLSFTVEVSGVTRFAVNVREARL